MVEQDYSTTVQYDRTIEQAILAIKKGAYLLKCRRRGKPKFCPFRLSTDEKYLIWYSGQEEKQLRLSSVTKIIPGQRTVNFQRQLQPDREEQSFSLVYANGERTLDLICKDKGQADSWFVGLRAVISKCHHFRTFSDFRSRRGVQSCVNSPAGYIRRKHNLGLEDGFEFSQVRSLCGSPSLSLQERCFSDGLSYSSDSFYSSDSSLSRVYDVSDVVVPNYAYNEKENLKGSNYGGREYPKKPSQRFVAPTYGSPRIERNDILKDVMIWGEAVVGGNIGGGFDRCDGQNGLEHDTLLPKLLDSTVMLDVRSIALGGKHAALVTKQGEVFSWGEGNGGKLGHRVNMDVAHPKLVESLNGVCIKSVACGEYQTCAVSELGELYTWGDNNHGGDFMAEGRNRCHWFPRKLFASMDGISVSAVACGEWHTAIISTSGQLFTYGEGTFGVLGHGNLLSTSQPKEVESLRGTKVKSVSCGPWHTAAIVEVMIDRHKYNAASGKLFTWGDNDKGRLGHSDEDRRLFPTCVTQLMDHEFVQVSCGRMFTVALTSSGTVYTMGSSLHGQLGNPRANDKSIIMVEGKLKGEFVKEISSGSCHIAVLTSGGIVYTWGKGANGQLGLGDTGDRNFPTLVEALKDRVVENIICRSNLTAAICLHKSISLHDQTTCSECKMPFGFTRKKHNCYNCGLLFCHGCSNKKVINASLARNKNKPSRVCNPCFNHLHKLPESGRSLKLENQSPRLLLTPKRPIAEDKDERQDTILKNGVRQPCNAESQESERKTLKNQEEKLHLSELASLPNVLPLLGHLNRKPAMSIALSESQLSFIDSPSFLKLPRGSKATECNSPYAEKSLSESNKMLTEEVERLKAEARNLETQCHLGNQKIQECQRQIEETWLLAKEEASKLKAAKEVIKALALRLHTMKGKVSSTKTGIDVSSPRTKLVDRKSPSLEHPMPVATRVPSDVKSPKQRKMDNVTDASLPITKLVERKSPSLEHPMPVATRVPSDVKSPKERQMDNVTDASRPITKLVDRKSPSLEHPMPVATRVPSDAKSPKERQTDNSCISPIISSGKLHSMRGNTICHESSRSLETSLATATEPPQNVSKASKLEWVEQYEPGVYVTFTTLPSGQKGLKRVRFSRKRFTEKEAGKWWEDNQVVVYQKYGIDGYTGSNQNQMRS